MREIVPVLLDVHFIRIESVQVNSGIIVFPHQLFQKRQRFRTKIIHFRCFIIKDDKNAVIAFYFCSCFMVNADTFTAVSIILRAFSSQVLFNFNSRCDFNNIFRLDGKIIAARQSFLLKGKNSDTGTLKINFPFVVAP